MVETIANRRPVGWFDQAPWRILIIGTALAFLVTIFLLTVVMNAPLPDIVRLVWSLSVTSMLSLGVAYWLYRRGWTRSPSLALTLTITYASAAVLALLNVYLISLQMFFNDHDLTLSSVLLIFAAIIATTFGIFVAAAVSDDLRQIGGTAQQIAGGDFGARVEVGGRDEIAALGHSFNSMAKQLEEAAGERERLDKMRRDLVAWTSHDLRTPLTSIRAMVEALNDGVITDDAMRQRYYRTIRSDVIALNGLIDDLFELAQLDAGGMRFEKSPTALGDLVSDALESFEALASQREITVSGIVPDNVGLVELNAQKISRVLSNLISNGLRHTPEGGHVTVCVEPREAEVAVLVKDSGTGFKPEDLANVFEQFYRGEEARSRATGGAGLGLAIARGIVRAHNGRIWAENQPEGGAVVGFSLPVD